MQFTPAQVDPAHHLGRENFLIDSELEASLKRETAAPPDRPVPLDVPAESTPILKRLGQRNGQQIVQGIQRICSVGDEPVATR